MSSWNSHLWWNLLQGLRKENWYSWTHYPAINRRNVKVIICRILGGEWLRHSNNVFNQDYWWCLQNMERQKNKNKKTPEKLVTRNLRSLFAFHIWQLAWQTKSHHAFFYFYLKGYTRGDNCFHYFRIIIRKRSVKLRKNCYKQARKLKKKDYLQERETRKTYLRHDNTRPHVVCLHKSHNLFGWYNLSQGHIGWSFALINVAFVIWKDRQDVFSVQAFFHICIALIPESFS